MDINVASLRTQHQWTEKHVLSKDMIAEIKQEADHDAKTHKTTRTSSIIEKLRSKKNMSTNDTNVIEEGGKVLSFAAARQIINSCTVAATTPLKQTIDVN